MRVSTRGRYGMNAIYELAMNYKGAPLSLKLISDKRSIPLPYLEQLIMQLRKAGIVKSIRGAHGGYILNLPPEEIAILNIIEILEGEIMPVQCKDEESCECCDHVSCPGEIVWGKIHTAIIKSLEGYTLANMISEYNQLEALIL